MGRYFVFFVDRDINLGKKIKTVIYEKQVRFFCSSHIAPHNPHLFICIISYFQYFDEKKALLSSLNLGLFPLFYFFAFLYYTDVGSTFLVLLMYSLHLDGNDWFASFIGALSVLFRQTNIVWVFFCGCNLLIRVLYNEVAQMEANDGPIQFSLTTLGQTTELLQGLYLLLFTPLKLLKLICFALKTCLGYISTGLLFIAFVIWNDGVVVGDR